jgi:DNA-binding MarR family transcriptional regulator
MLLCKNKQTPPTMQKIIEDLKKYVFQALGLQVDVLSFDKYPDLPVFLAVAYKFYKAIILGKQYVLVLAKDPTAFTPNQIATQMEMLEKKLKKPCLYIANYLIAYNRQRLMKYKVPFVIPGIQMYLPDLGLDCRKAEVKKVKASTVLTPSAQTIVIYALINRSLGPFSPSYLAKILNYSPMTMTRALTNLEALGLGVTYRQAKKRLFHFHKNETGFSLWRQALSYMQSPVRESHWIKADKLTIRLIQQSGYIANLSALALQTSIIPPSLPVFAIYDNPSNNKQSLLKFDILPISEGAQMKVEFWKYDPALFAKDHRVIDDFSLYLSLKNIHDERIEKALETLLEKHWKLEK